MPPVWREKVVPHPRQPRQQILQLRQLDLQSSFATAGTLGENIEDQLRAIEHLAREQVFQITALRRRKLIIENHRGDLLVLERFLDQLRFAAPDVVGRRRFLQFLRDGADHFRAGGVGQLAQFLHRIAQIPFRDAVLFEADQDRALLRFLRANFNHPFAQTRDVRFARSIRWLRGSRAMISSVVRNYLGAETRSTVFWHNAAWPAGFLRCTPARKFPPRAKRESPANPALFPRSSRDRAALALLPPRPRQTFFRRGDRSVRKAPRVLERRKMPVVAEAGPPWRVPSAADTAVPLGTAASTACHSVR